MPHPRVNKYVGLTLFTIFFTTSLVACGGSGGDSGSASNDDIVKPNTPTPTDTCKDKTASNSGQADLDEDEITDNCDDDIDGDGVVNAKDARPLDATIAGISTRSYKGDGFGYTNATESFYFNGKNQLVEQEYLSSSNPDRANTSTQFTYDNKDRLIRREQTRGLDKRNDGIEVWVYDQKGQLTEFNTNSDGNSIFERTVTYQYNSNGNIEQIVEKDTSDSRFFYNSTRTYTYNSSNQLEKIETDEYNDGSIDRVEDIIFNINNYLAKSALSFVRVDEDTNNDIRELRNTLEFSYDNQGNVTKVVDSSIDYGSVRAVTYSYDNQKNIIKKTTNDEPSVIDIEVSYNNLGLATSATEAYEGFRANVQNVINKAEYNNAGYLTKTLVDVSQNGKVNQEITYSYEGSVPLKFNMPTFIDFGLSNNRAPTATSLLNKVNARYTADMIKESYYD